MPNDLFHTDIQLTQRGFGVATNDREDVDFIADTSGDLVVSAGRSNLAQAIINRLLTRKGELTKLGHPSYGSRLYELIGELNIVRLQGRAELYIRDCLAQEPRIQEVVEVAFAVVNRKEERHDLPVRITVLPMDGQLLQIVLPIAN